MHLVNNSQKSCQRVLPSGLELEISYLLVMGGQMNEQGRLLGWVATNLLGFFVLLAPLQPVPAVLEYWGVYWSIVMGGRAVA